MTEISDAGMIHTLDLVKKLAEAPVWSLGCTISQEAVTLAAGVLGVLDIPIE